MSGALGQFPLSFWAVIVACVTGFGVAATRIRDGSGLPMMAVLMTVLFWYPGDAIYNDYANYHVALFEPNILTSAWWEVVWFVVAFTVLAPVVHAKLNASLLSNGSGTLRLLRHGVDELGFQDQTRRMFKGCLYIWLALIALATLRVGSDVCFFLFPFLGHSVAAFGRARVGGGIDFIYTILFYVDELACAGFGIVAALCRDRRIRMAALAMCLVSWPTFLFDRTRNNILVVIMPGILAWGFLGIRGNIIKKLAVLGLCFMLVNTWMKFIIANRSEAEVGAVFGREGINLKEESKARHEGLNMYEELCWINTFIEKGTYKINWGRRYFAEMVNVVPRGLWHGKPDIGLDYAIARGGGNEKGNAEDAGVTTTFSTGLIGQGVANFGTFLGPLAAAFLISLWCAVLARSDLQGFIPGNIPLFGLGLILTFNTGRDLTFIVLYPFIFGALLIKWQNRHKNYSLPQQGQTSSAPRIPAPTRRTVPSCLKPLRRRPLTR